MTWCNSTIALGIAGARALEGVGQSYRARYYDPAAGRFLSEDPAGFDSDADFYTYTRNNAVSWSDPEGLRKVKVCRQGLKRFHGLISWLGHTYIRVYNDDGTETTYGILGDKGSTKNQKPRKDDPRNKGRDCKPVTGCDNQLDKLINGLEQSYNSGTCPSCGPNYKPWIPTDLVHFLDGYNSNTYVFNMIQGAGMTPPPEPRSPGYHQAPGDWYPK